MINLSNILNVISEVVMASDSVKVTLPFGTVNANEANSNQAPYVRIHPFGPRFQRIANNEIENLFCEGWELKVTVNLDAANLFAITKGAVSFETQIISGQQVNVLLLYTANFLGNVLLRERNHLPSWFPIPKIVVYQNIDELDYRAKLTQHLTNHPDVHTRVVERIKELSGNENYNGTIAEIIEASISGQVNSLGILLSEKIWLEVDSGTPIGKMGLSQDPNERMCTIKFLENDEMLVPEYLNPSYFFNLIHNVGLTVIDYSTHPLSAFLLKSTETILASGVIRFVSAGGTDIPNNQAGDHYKSVQNPATTITSAIHHSNPSDYILILDNSTYQENEIIINKSITLCGLNRIPNYVLVSEQHQIPDFPHLDGQQNHRVIKIDPITSGIVYVGHLIIENGSAGDIGGGGLLINGYQNQSTVNQSRVVISNCLIRNNKATGYDFAHGFGGGIFCYHSSPLVYGCTIKYNESNRRGAGIGCFGYG